jgi:hypothetical protein
VISSGVVRVSDADMARIIPLRALLR